MGPLSPFQGLETKKLSQAFWLWEGFLNLLNTCCQVLRGNAHLELNNLFKTFNNFDFIGMLAFAITLDHQFLFLGVDSQAYQASFPVRRYNLRDRMGEVASVLISSLTILWRGCSI